MVQEQVEEPVLALLRWLRSYEYANGSLDFPFSSASRVSSQGSGCPKLSRRTATGDDLAILTVSTVYHSSSGDPRACARGQWRVLSLQRALS